MGSGMTSDVEIRQIIRNTGGAEISKNDNLEQIYINRATTFTLPHLKVMTNPKLMTIGEDFSTTQMIVHGNPSLPPAILQTLKASSLNGSNIQPEGECMFDGKISDFSTLKVCKIVEGNLELDDNVTKTAKEGYNFGEKEQQSKRKQKTGQSKKVGCSKMSTENPEKKPSEQPNQQGEAEEPQQPGNKPGNKPGDSLKFGPLVEEGKSEETRFSGTADASNPLLNPAVQAGILARHPPKGPRPKKTNA